mmetsp:Transcript_45848/g.143429  ORF Transcript_45848/g.143429 Transcript_45848/m.143429 type:complete len:260 (-) Transcript_45848:992-1771(-)
MPSRRGMRAMISSHWSSSSASESRERLSMKFVRPKGACPEEPLGADDTSSSSSSSSSGSLLLSSLGVHSCGASFPESRRSPIAMGALAMVGKSSTSKAHRRVSLLPKTESTSCSSSAFHGFCSSSSTCAVMDTRITCDTPENFSVAASSVCLTKGSAWRTLLNTRFATLLMQSSNVSFMLNSDKRTLKDAPMSRTLRTLSELRPSQSVAHSLVLSSESTSASMLSLPAVSGSMMPFSQSLSSCDDHTGAVRFSRTCAAT